MNKVDRQISMVRMTEENFTQKFLCRFFFGVCGVVRKVLLFIYRMVQAMELKQWMLGNTLVGESMR